MNVQVIKHFGDLIPKIKYFVTVEVDYQYYARPFGVVAREPGAPDSAN